jgi:hypothetical protein
MTNSRLSTREHIRDAELNPEQLKELALIVDSMSGDEDLDSAYYQDIDINTETINLQPWRHICACCDFAERFIASGGLEGYHRERINKERSLETIEKIKGYRHMLNASKHLHRTLADEMEAEAKATTDE